MKKYAEQADEERYKGPTQHTAAEALDECSTEDDAKGVGPFLLAYTELLRYENK